MKQNSFLLALKGAAMGVAEVIPGVSGGTIAFITGIYERLIRCIKSFDLRFLSLLANGNVRSAARAVDLGFLFWLLLGMAAGGIIAIFTVTHLLENYPPVIWAFFFGLIIASAIYIVRQIRGWNAVSFLSLAVGIAVAYMIVQLTPAEGSERMWYLFMSGMLAICALILPGISGSFILLLLGMYTVIIPTIKEFLSTFDPGLLPSLAIFAAGCVLGLAVFSRVLSWAFVRYRNPILCLLCGFMIGSLRKIWPWRNVQSWLDENGNLVVDTGQDLGSLPLHEIKVMTETNVIPSVYEMGDPYLLASILSALAGVLIIFAFDILDKKLPTSS